MMRLGLLGPCWAKAGTQKRGGCLREVARTLVLRQGALEAPEEAEGGLCQRPASLPAACRPQHSAHLSI